MSSSAGPSRVSRPRRSSSATSNGSTASSTGTDEGARTGASVVILMSDCESMALYLGSEHAKRKGVERGETISASRPCLVRNCALGAGTHNHRLLLLQTVSTTSL